MEYRRLGRSGLKLSALSYGSWLTFGNQLDVEGATACMTAAYDEGCNFFDNAEVYAHGRSEEIMGEALRKLGWQRDSYVVSSKVFFGSKADPKPTQCGLSRKHVVEACDQALRRLGLDHLDLYFCHRPDPDTPIEETVRVMGELIQRGKVLYWGTSEWSAVQLMEAHRVAREFNLVPPTMEQPQYNMFERARVELEYKPLYELGLGTTTWSPLASGILTGKYTGGIPAGTRMTVPGYEWLRSLVESPGGKRHIEKAGKLQDIADDLGCSMAQLAIAWCLANPQVSTVITGASKLDQLRENMRAAGFVSKLDAEVRDRIEGVLDNKPGERRAL